MNWVTVLCSMIGAACVTVAAIHLFVWLRDRDARTSLLMSDCGLAAAVIVAFDVALMHAQTPAQFGTLLRWLHVPLSWALISVVLFARQLLDAGRTWLMWSAIGTRAVALVLNFVTGVNLNFRTITSIETVRVLGEPITVPVGKPNPWMLIGNASVVLFLAYLLDASITAWRNGRRGHAALIGGVLAPATTFALIRAMQFVAGAASLRSPYFISLVPLGFLIVVAVGLSGDLLRATVLERELRESHEQMGVAQAELDRVSRLTAMGEFAAALAHEILQPISAVTLSAKMALHELHDPEPNLEEVHASVRGALEAGQRAAEVAQRNRELFRHRTVRSAWIDINGVIEETRVLAARRLIENGVNVVTSLGKNLPAVQGDRVELQQVLLNLIANAIDATESQPARRVWIRSSEEPKGIRVEVGDNGVGLAGVDTARMFTLSYTTKPTGTGVGLSVSRAIVDAHGGRIWAEPNSEGGASVCFTLPAESAGAPSDAYHSAEQEKARL